ncbi:MAG: transporter substrate-binding domain-containing protein [Pseudomonadales bacterium]|nr:transporter substrate-binding domain-containing protein [Pseudomonadales bacterium]
MEYMLKSYRALLPASWIAYLWILPALFFSFQVSAAQAVLHFNVTGQPPLNTAAHNGFLDEVSREALARIGYQLVVDRLPAERGLRNTNLGFSDGEMSRVEGVDRLYPNLIRVPEKIMDWEFVIFTKQRINLYRGWHSLENRDVGFITGWKIVEEHMPVTAIITKTSNADQLFSLLQKDRVEMVIYESWGGRYLAQESGFDTIRIQKPALEKKEMYIYLHKNHESLVPKLAQALADMKRDGSYAEMVKTHLTNLINKDTSWQ